MADTMQFDLVSPERKLASVQALQVQLPGAEGDMTAMPDHAPVLTTLRPGVVIITTATGDEEYVITGGFAEINAVGTTVLAEQALPKSEVTRDVLEAFLAKAQKELEGATAERQDAAAKHVSDHQELLIRHAG